MIGESRTTLMGGGFRFEACLALLDVEAIPSAVGCSTDHVFCCLIVGAPRFSNLYSTVPVDVVRVRSLPNFP